MSLLQQRFKGYLAGSAACTANGLAADRLAACRLVGLPELPGAVETERKTVPNEHLVGT